MNSRYIVVVHIGFRFLIMSSFTSKDRGSNIGYKKCSNFGLFFSHENSLVNILLNKMEQNFVSIW